MKILKLIFGLYLSLNISNSHCQIAPSAVENFDYLMTFGKGASAEWGDDDNTQIHFFVIPKTEQKAVYIRVFDPSTSGAHDTKNGSFNTTTTFSVYGGKGAHSTKASRAINPILGYDSGNKMYSKSFKNDSEYDGKWYSFGPINPHEGEYSDQFNGYIFKVICKGGSGDDGNAYKYSLSYKKDANISIQNGNIFTYEISFKLNKKKGSIAHVYPFITKSIKDVSIYNFDADNDIYIKLTSIARKLVPSEVSQNGNWKWKTFKIYQKEYNTSIDIQMIKKNDGDNDMAIYILNQYKDAVPLFSVPIGGKPKYLYNVKVKYKF